LLFEMFCTGVSNRPFSFWLEYAPDPFRNELFWSLSSTLEVIAPFMHLLEELRDSFEV
jgi:hypothetical protein